MRMNQYCDSQWAQMLFICFAGCVITFGCASTEKQKCVNAAWFSIGYWDGAQGYPASRIAVHRKACFAYDVHPDTALYEQGRIQGLREFCTPSNGYVLGSHGYHYNGECPADDEPDFLNALDMGRRLYYLELTENAEQNALNRAYETLETLERKIARKQADLAQTGIGANIGASQRLISDVETLVEQQKELLVRINAHQTKLEAIRQNLKFMRNGQLMP